MQIVLPSMFVEGEVPWVSCGFSLYCVNGIMCCKVSNAAYSCTRIFQLKYNFYFSIAWESEVTQGETFGCTCGHRNL